MKPVKVERRKDRQKSNRKRRDKFDFAEQHCVYYTTAEEIERAQIEHKEVRYFKVHLAEQIQGDSYLDGRDKDN